jgi:hypothetical protein
MGRGQAAPAKQIAKGLLRQPPALGGHIATLWLSQGQAAPAKQIAKGLLSQPWSAVRIQAPFFARCRIGAPLNDLCQRLPRFICRGIA